MALVRKVVCPHIQTAEFDGFGEDWRVDDDASFESVWQHNEQDLRTAVRARGFVILHCPVTQFRHGTIPWVKAEDIFFVEIPFHTDGYCGDQIVLLTQHAQALPRSPGTLIAPASVVNEALKKEKYYQTPSRQSMRGLLAQPNPEQYLLHEVMYQHWLPRRQAAILDIQRDIAQAEAANMYCHDWWQNDGAVLLVDVSCPPINTVHARLFGYEGEKLWGGPFFRALIR
ncbi:MAG: hypothetical protein HY817_02455 [Candidatus Abawacabacteria bacterium]|nr:hypothetical protein [Candidatus Abawacabacteria bacterium]